MAVIQCKYYDKSYKPMKDLGNISFCRRDYAHALLSLHSEFRHDIKTFFKYLSYLFDASSHFRFPSRGELIFKQHQGYIYDGFDKAESDIFGAIVTIIVAEKKYGHRRVSPLSPEQVVSNNGKRPDFIATDGVNYSLFESKGSFHSKTKDVKSAVKRGVDQLNGASSVLLDGHRNISVFKEKVVVVTSLTDNDEVMCDICDPENKKGMQINYEISKEYENYYLFIRGLIDYSKGKKEIKEEKGKSIACSTFTFENVSVEIGLLEELYLNNVNGFERINDVIGTIKNNGFHSCLYGDGVYLRIKDNKR